MLNNAHPQGTTFAINFITQDEDTLGPGILSELYKVKEPIDGHGPVCNGVLIFPADSVQPSSLSNPILS